MQENLRDIALKILMEVMEKKNYLHIEMNRALEKYDYLKRSDKAFIRRLTSGTVERCVTIDAAINHVSSVKIKKMKPYIRSILRLTAYQILFMDNVADAVAVDEAVKLVKKYRINQLSGFVNGVSRSIIREKATLKYTTEQELAITNDIYEVLSRQYPDKAQNICEAYLKHEHKGTIIRVNRSKLDDGTEKELMDSLGAEPLCPEIGCYAIKNMNGVSELDGFDDGLFVIMDTAAGLPVYLSGAKPGDNVLDLCAAPGGKTIQAADQLKNDGLVAARDISYSRCEMIEEACLRCGFDICVVTAADATINVPDDEKKYDVCLVDAPCSGLGVIGSKPDIRFHYDKNSLEELRNIQKEIINAAVKTVKPGGILVYSTCTLDRRENEEQLRYAGTLRASEVVDIKDKLPGCFTDYEYKDGALTIFPTDGVCEGFFVGVIRMDDHE